MNGVLFGFEFMCGVALFLFIVWVIVRWFHGKKQTDPRISYKMSLRDWLWLGLAVIALVYPILAYIDGHK